MKITYNVCGKYAKITRMYDGAKKNYNILSVLQQKRNSKLLNCNINKEMEKLFTISHTFLL